MNPGRHSLVRSSLLLSRFVASPSRMTRDVEDVVTKWPGRRRWQNQKPEQSQANTPSLASGCQGVYLMRLLLLFWACVAFVALNFEALSCA